MENRIDFIISPKFWTVANNFGLNTNLLETNLINLGVVIGLLFYFGKGSLSNLLKNRKLTILNTIRDAEERYKEATYKLKQAKTRPQQAKTKADDIRTSGLSQIDRERKELIDAADGDSKRLEDSKNTTIRFEKQRAIEQVRQQVSRLALERALETLKNCLSTELHLRMIDHNIGLLRAMESTIE
uniref:ATP synthase subunit b, chloroplastic n=1 Tax=Porella perrottetiana TaxID=460663 RepID=A0A4Y5P5J8_9MARC|nr:ATP synthase CF0 subunit I [Porella perrottetiana]QCW58574.1 ATP synthase CF0 subunit I [Porella perrottetiana]